MTYDAALDRWAPVLMFETEDRSLGLGILTRIFQTPVDWKPTLHQEDQPGQRLLHENETMVQVLGDHLDRTTTFYVDLRGATLTQDAKVREFQRICRILDDDCVAIFQYDGTGDILRDNFRLVKETAYLVW